jgi:AcrR family transcriptional regulator/DNA-binding MarR family transcriptional regulator
MHTGRRDDMRDKGGASTVRPAPGRPGTRGGVPANGLTRAHPGAGQAIGHERVLDIQRARILAAMAEVSAERGAADVTVAHLVQRAGVSRRTFYEIFEDREACFIRAFDECVERAYRHALAGYDPHERWAARVRGALVGLLSFLDSDPTAAQLLVVGSLAAGPRALVRRRAVLARTIALVDEGRAVAHDGAELPSVTAEGVVGGVLSVLWSRLLDPDAGPLIELTGPLMGMIVLPYLGQAAARRENAIPIPKNPLLAHRPQGNPLGQLEMRLTYRTVRVLMAIASHPGSSNRVVADAAEVSDQGQMSKLLARLHDIGLIANAGGGAARGEPNAWTLTDKGWGVQEAIAEETSRG